MTPVQPRNPAQMYEDYFVPAMLLPWAKALVRRAAPQRGMRVLDVACGTGIVSRQVAPMVGENGQVVALDMNPGMLAVARALPPASVASIQWLEGNAMSLPFPDNSFDLALCQHGLSFVPDRAAALREMRRVVAPTGRVLAIVLQALYLHPVFEILMNSVAKRLSLPLSAVSTPFTLSDPAELRELFAASGFTHTEIVKESITAVFPDADRFVPMAVTSSAAAIPAFVQLDEPQREALMESVRADVEPTLNPYRNSDSLSFPMFAHLAIGTP